jgi:integrase
VSNHGLGHVRLRGDIYYIKYYKDGKPFYESSGSKFKQDAINLLKTRTASPVAVKSVTVKIGELLDDYEAYAKVHNAKSYETFGKVIAGRGPPEEKATPLREFWEDRKASKITSRTIDDYIEKRLAEKKQRGGGDVTAATVNRELAVLRKAFNLAKEATPPKVGFVPKFRMLPESEPRKGFLTLEQYRALLEALPEELRLPLMIGYYTGARYSEVVGIRLDQVDQHDAEIRLYDTKRHKEDGSPSMASWGQPLQRKSK